MSAEIPRFVPQFPDSAYRVHIEFDDNDVASLVAKIPDRATGSKGTHARIAPDAKMAMKM
ncbi:MAG TPA: hypothetical protein VGN99_01935 [Steroidobacteraceae bacterium]|nr:hypothetical protein [Steroidobacteraceae bacterium]